MSLIRYRNGILWLDSLCLLTRGKSIAVGTFLDRLISSQSQVFAVSPGYAGRPDRIGAFRKGSTDKNAHLSFILPDHAINSIETSRLLDGLAVKAGCCGVLNLLADLNEDHDAFEVFRKCGYSVYSHQNIYSFRGTPRFEESFEWKSITPEFGNAVKTLYQELVPPLVQGTEILSIQDIKGWIGFKQGEPIGIAFACSGTAGNFIQPLIHPDVESPERLLTSLLQKIQSINRLPIYFSIRSYQAWLEKYLTGEDWLAARRQVLLVKHLATYQRVSLVQDKRVLMESGPQTEPTALMHGGTIHQHKI